MSETVKHVLKALATILVLVLLFWEFGGGPVEVRTADIQADRAFEKANPAYPGILSRLKAQVSGAELPPRTVPIPTAQVCRAGAEGPIFVHTASGELKRIKTLRHCEADVLARGVDADGNELALASAGERFWMTSQGFQLVEMDWKDLWREVTSVELAVFLPWFLFATLIKLVGIFANIWRWQILLAGQGLRFGFGWLTASYFVGRYFGIVTPSTMGLDGWRLYDTAKVSGRFVESATAIVVERVIGLVGLLTVILMFMPFAELGGRDLAEVLSAVKPLIAAAMVFGLMLLLQPAWFSPLVRLMPHPKLRAFLDNTIQAATAYSAHRGALMLALGCAVFGQITTMFMYFGNAMALQVENVTMTQVLYASAVMTLGTFLAPSASGEGVREIVFVALLGGHTTAAKAFLIGHLGFWIEKLPLSIPGAYFLIRAPEAYQKVSREDLDRLRDELKPA